RDDLCGFIAKPRRSRPRAPRRACSLAPRRAGRHREARGGEIVSPRRYEANNSGVEAGRELLERSSRPLGRAPVTDTAQELVGEACRELVLARARRAARLEVI